MKKHLIVILVLVSAAVTGCKLSRKPAVNTTILITENTDGTVLIESSGFGKNLADIEKNAISNAFEKLLYVGIPSASSEANRLPMIPSKDNYQNSPRMRSFFNDEEYKNYIIEMNRLNYLKNRSASKGKALNFHITINKPALRRFLEKNEIIREFGY